MTNIFPFFNYDVLARIIPGAFTLAILLTLPPFKDVGKLLPKPGEDAVLPLVLAGLSYLIGVIYEAIGHTWLVRVTVSSRLEDWAFNHAWGRFVEENPKYTDLFQDTKVDKAAAKKADRALRTSFWERLVFEAAEKTEMREVFAHCHRFQAEYKMFWHLTVPGFIFSLLCSRSAIWWRLALAFVLFGALCFLSYRRDERRWWQVLSFSKELGWLDEMQPKSLPVSAQ